MDESLPVETIEKYERRVEEIEAERKRISTMEVFERRIDELEAQLKPQLDELSALKAGLERLRQGPGSDPAVKRAVVSNPRSHANMAGPTVSQAASARRRR